MSRLCRAAATPVGSIPYTNKGLPIRWLRQLTDARWQHHDLGADRRAVVEVNHVVVDHANAPGGNVLADGPWLVRTVDPVEGVFVSLPQVQGAGTEWIVSAAGQSHTALQFFHSWSELGPALEDILGRIPVRPFLLVVDLRHAGPAKPFAADAHSVAQGSTARLHEVKEVLRRIDNDSTPRLSCGVLDVCAPVGRIDIRQPRWRADTAGKSPGSANCGGSRYQCTAAQCRHGLVDLGGCVSIAI